MRLCLGPAALEGNEELVDDLAQFRRHRNRGVMTASRSIIQMLKEVNPALLKRKQRGKPSEHLAEKMEHALKGSGGPVISGAEVLLNKDEEGDSDGSRSEECDSEAGEGGGDSDDGQEEVGSEEEEEEVDGQQQEEEEWETDDEDDSDDEEVQPSDSEKPEGETEEGTAQKSTVEELLKSRILTDDDFKKIKIESLRKKMQFSNKRQNKTGTKRALQLNQQKGSKRAKMSNEDGQGEGEEEIAEIDSEDLETSSDESEHELPTYESIAKVNMKRRHDKEAKLATALAGREGREKFGRPQKRQNPHASSTNVEKGKAKNFMMLRHKIKKKSRTKSFVERQQKLKNSLKRRYPK